MVLVSMEGGGARRDEAGVGQGWRRVMCVEGQSVKGN